MFMAQYSAEIKNRIKGALRPGARTGARVLRGVVVLCDYGESGFIQRQCWPEGPEPSL